MKKILINQEQSNNLIDNLIIETKIDSYGVNMIIKNLNQKFNKFKNNYDEQINNTNKIINMSQLIEEMKEFLINETSNVLKNNIDHKTFLEKYYNFLYGKFKESTNEIGWKKKKLVKLVLGNKNKAIKTIDTWKFKDIIWVLLYLGNIGGDINSNWGQNYKKIVSNNKQLYYEKLRNLLIQKIY